ncbi:hypothetical protein ACFL0M_13405 [Thermodesulfobacteriota bacterium]
MRTNYPHPSLPFGYCFYNNKCSLNPFVFSNKTVSHQFSCKIQVLNQLVGAHEQGEPPWKLLFEKLEGYFNARFGPDWKNKQAEFWTKFSQTYHISEGIKQRLMHEKEIIDKGI